MTINSDWIYADNDTVVRLNMYYKINIRETSNAFQIEGCRKENDTTFYDLLFKCDTKNEADNKLEKIARKLGANI